MSDNSIPEGTGNPPTPPPHPGTASAPQAATPFVPPAAPSQPPYLQQTPPQAALYVPPAPQGYPGQAAVYAPPSAPVHPMPGYPGPQYAAPMYQARPNSGLAVAAMICGIVGFLFGWATALIVVPILVSIAAVVLGHIALSQLKKNQGLGGRGMAITGLVLGYIPLAIALVVAIFAVFAFVTVGAFTLPFVFSS